MPDDVGKSTLFPPSLSCRSHQSATRGQRKATPFPVRAVIVLHDVLTQLQLVVNGQRQITGCIVFDPIRTNYRASAQRYIEPKDDIFGTTFTLSQTLQNMECIIMVIQVTG